MRRSSPDANWQGRILSDTSHRREAAPRKGANPPPELSGAVGQEDGMSTHGSLLWVRRSRLELRHFLTE